MKIFSSEGNGIFEFGSAWIKMQGSHSVVYGKDFGNSVGVPLGVYSDYARAKGVLFDIITAYKRKDDVYYMPEE